MLIRPDYMSKKRSSFWGSFSIFFFFFFFFFISVAQQQALWTTYRSGMVIFELNHRAGSGIAFDLFGSKSPESAQFWPQSRHNCLFGDFFLNFCIFWTLFHSNSSFLASGLANLGSQGPQKSFGAIFWKIQKFGFLSLTDIKIYTFRFFLIKYHETSPNNVKTHSQTNVWARSWPISIKSPSQPTVHSGLGGGNSTNVRWPKTLIFYHFLKVKS